MQKKRLTQLRKTALYYVLPSFIIMMMSCSVIYFSMYYIIHHEDTTAFTFGDNYGYLADFFNGITTPILTIITALFALWAFLSQKEQLKLQKEESVRQRIEGTFFQLFDLHSNMVRDLVYEAPNGFGRHGGQGFFKKAYTDLMQIYLAEEDTDEDLRLLASMQKLDKIHANNFHLYYKNLFQLFYWIYEHREQLSENQRNSYVELIRAQLSHYQMMLVYFNAKFFGRNFFYKVLDELNFLNKYNLDGHGSVEEKFRMEVEAFQSQNSEPAATLENINTTTCAFSRDELFQALQKQEIKIHYQPIVDRDTFKVICSEALLRWNHPEKGEVKPNEFVHQMENYGLTHDVFEYLLRNVCEHIKKDKTNVVYSVNISVEQLLLSGLSESVSNICREYRVQPDRLQFEITESKELYKRKQIKQIMHSLRTKGFRVGLDDFGNGYFSFNDLVDLQIDFMKLDKSLVYKLDQEPNLESTIKKMLEIFRLQEWDVTVEGIETADQLKTWQNLGVDAMQGYYIGKPKA
ncbi:MAG TPA: EAL domain-containing protein [Virgibacillus sp.]|nr:EAL domain-containing protein [Virgibacillus sp.]HLR68218.1 EAL domain-containing protein [Virgibacillus sp.]